MTSKGPTCPRSQACCALILTGVLAQAPVPPPTPQNPSPMEEHTRRHGRLSERALPGARASVDGLLSRPVTTFVPAAASRRRSVRLLVHFHGAAFVPEHAVSRAAGRYALAVVHLGPGSGVYERAFDDPATFDALLAAIRRQIAASLGGRDVAGVALSGYSAGHGAIRAILREPRHAAAIGGVLLLDGLHTAYLPPRTVLADGGSLDASALAPFVRFAELAAAGRKAMVVTHSEIFPGTFASTTETADYLIRALGLTRMPVLEWGPLGMQQLSAVRRGRLLILGFAGNSAPDHVDHFHAMPDFLERLEE